MSEIFSLEKCTIEKSYMGFVVINKDEGKALVINSKTLNQAIVNENCKEENIVEYLG